MATDIGVTRLSKLFCIFREEVMNRVTIRGTVEIRRLPGVVTDPTLQVQPKPGESQGSPVLVHKAELLFFRLQQRSPTPSIKIECILTFRAYWEWAPFVGDMLLLS
jgi:hypothetical protein